MLEEMIDRAKSFFNRTTDFTNEAVCKLEKSNYGDTFFLGAILLSLRQLLEESKPLGMAYYRITPIQLTGTPKKVVEKQPEGRLRKVSFAIDSAVGGPTPTIRFGNSSVSATAGGVRLTAGSIHDLGEMPPDMELYAASNVDIAAYIIERA